MINGKKAFNYLNILLDAIVIVVTCVLTWFIVFKFKLFNIDTEVSLVPFYLISVCLIPVHLILYSTFHLYISEHTNSVWTEIVNRCKSNLIGIMIFIAVVYIFKKSFYMNYFPRFFIIIFLFLNTLLMLIVQEGKGRSRYKMKKKVV